MAKDQQQPSQPPEEEPSEGKTRSPVEDELLAMRRMSKLLGTLDEPAKGRVVRWLADIYYCDCPTPPRSCP